MPDQLVQYSVDRAIARVTLDSPRNRNALSAALVEDLAAALSAAASDDSVRAVELAHTGPAFCAGADLAEARLSSPGGHSDPRGSPGPRGPGAPRGDGMKAATARLLALLRQMVALDKPVVGSINGHARAGGLGLVGACDIVVAGPASTFAFTEVRLGLAPAMISLTTLPRLDARAASRYFLTGETFGPATAERIGLISEAVEDIDQGTTAVLDALRAASPQGLRETKPLLTAAILEGFEARAEALAEQSARLFGSAEAAEGMAAFLEKRPPAWLPTRAEG